MVPLPSLMVQALIDLVAKEQWKISLLCLAFPFRVFEASGTQWKFCPLENKEADTQH